MSKVQPATIPASKRPAKQMYRGVITANAVVDVFVRAASDVDASAAIKRGKGQRMKLRFSPWQVCQEAIAVDGYRASNIPVQEITTPELIAQVCEKVYTQVLHKITVVRRSAYSDRKRQAMEEAVKEFYEMLMKECAGK